MNLGVRDSWLALPASPTPTVEVPMNDTTPNPTIVVIIQVACDPASSGYSQLTQAVHAAVRASLDAQAALPATPVALADRTVTHTRHVGRTPQPRALGPNPPRPEPCCHDPRCDRNLLCLLLSPDSIRMIARRFFWSERTLYRRLRELYTTHHLGGRNQVSVRCLSGLRCADANTPFVADEAS